MQWKLRREGRILAGIARKRGEGTNAVEERLATPSPHEMGVGVRRHGLVNSEIWYKPALRSFARPMLLPSSTE